MRIIAKFWISYGSATAFSCSGLGGVCFIITCLQVMHLMMQPTHRAQFVDIYSAVIWGLATIATLLIGVIYAGLAVWGINYEAHQYMKDHVEKN